jgi:Secretory lipase
MHRRQYGRRGVWLALLLTMVMLWVGACHVRPPSTAPPAGRSMGPGPIVLPDPSITPDDWANRGRVANRDPLPGLDPNLAEVTAGAMRAVYGSASGIDGSATAVSGAFFVPRGRPPVGGWPVVAMAHATVGTTADCAPSLHPGDLMGYSPGITTMLSKGYAVALPDYQGLGMPGVHPYLEPRTAAFNVIDAVRAIREIFPDVSTRWLAMGGSQGGQAAWAANEFDTFYGGGLQLVGTVAVAPPVDISPMAQMAFNETLNIGQLGLTPFLLTGLEKTIPNFPISNFVHGKALELRESAVGCTADAQRLRIQLTPGDLRPDSQEDTDYLRDILRTWAMPQRPLAAPMLVINGLEDQVVLPVWVTTAIDRSCALGGVVEHYAVADGGHFNLQADQKFVEEWARDRFAGKPAPSVCPQEAAK